jgi:hypothetical protein
MNGKRKKITPYLIYLTLLVFVVPWALKNSEPLQARGMNHEKNKNRKPGIELGELQRKTLLSLKLVDDNPIPVYVMTYYGGYDFENFS